MDDINQLMKEYVRTSEEVRTQLLDKVASLEAEIVSMQEGLTKTASAKAYKVGAVVDKLIQVGEFKEANRSMAIQSLSSDYDLVLDCLDKMASDSIGRKSVVPSLGRSIPMVETSNSVSSSDQAWSEGIRDLARYSR